MAMQDLAPGEEAECTPEELEMMIGHAKVLYAGMAQIINQRQPPSDYLFHIVGLAVANLVKVAADGCEAAQQEFLEQFQMSIADSLKPPATSH